MACGVAIDIDGHGKAGDMGGHVFDVHLERSNATAQALGTDPQPVDELEQFILKGGIAGIAVAGVDIPAAGCLGA